MGRFDRSQLLFLAVLVIGFVYEASRVLHEASSRRMIGPAR